MFFYGHSIRNKTWHFYPIFDINISTLYFGSFLKLLAFIFVYAYKKFVSWSKSSKIEYKEHHFFIPVFKHNIFLNIIWICQLYWVLILSYPSQIILYHVNMFKYRYLFYNLLVHIYRTFIRMLYKLMYVLKRRNYR